MIDKIICFDFDGTLFHTFDRCQGEKVFKEKTGLDWPYNGWWGKPESIDMDIFHIPLNGWVYQRYLEAVSDPTAHVILATGRLEKPIYMRENIERILDYHNLSFDVFEPLNVIEIGSPSRVVIRNGVYLNTGGDTFMFKTRLFEDMMRKMKVNELLIYDDRHEHLCKFSDWAHKQSNSKITICDVVNKKFKTIEK
jgi:hypothetical protein